jgi:hypothetical protein
MLGEFPGDTWHIRWTLGKPLALMEELNDALSYAGVREVDTRAVLVGFVGWIWCSCVSLLVSNAESEAFCCASGDTSMFIFSLICMSSSWIPKV